MNKTDVELLRNAIIECIRKDSFKMGVIDVD